MLAKKIRKTILNWLLKDGLPDVKIGEDPTVITGAHITLPGQTADPALAAGRIWLRSDLGRLRISPDGTTIKTLPNAEDPNTFTDLQKIYAPDKSQLLLFRDSGLTQGGSLLTYGADGRLYAAGNGYYDGANWLRMNTSYPLLALLLDALNDKISVMRAAAGANPATLSEIFRIRNDGRIVVPDMSSIITSYGQISPGYGGKTSYGLIYLPSAVESVLSRSGYVISACAYVYANTLNSTTYINLHDNSGIYGDLGLLTILASSTGWFTASLNQPVAANARWVYRVDTTASTSGSMTIYSIAIGVA